MKKKSRNVDPFKTNDSIEAAWSYYDAIDFFQKYPNNFTKIGILSRIPLWFKEGSYFKVWDFELSNYPKEIFRETYIPMVMSIF